MKTEQNNPNHSTSSSQNFSLVTTNNFISEATHLKTKYPNIKDDFFQLAQRLASDPINAGKYLGNGCYKVRMKISDKNNGKSGGARVIIHVKIIDKRVYVLSVFDKSEKTNLADGELERLMLNAIPSRDTAPGI